MCHSNRCCRARSEYRAKQSLGDATSVDATVFIGKVNKPSPDKHSGGSRICGLLDLLLTILRRRGGVLLTLLYYHAQYAFYIDKLRLLILVHGLPPP